jgi:beta-fructofuranosidase
MMLITTVLRSGSIWKGGALAVARSSDLLEWQRGEVIYYPGNHSFPECSEVFQIDGTWYMVCSIFDKTCYRIGDSPTGPWRTGKTESFDGVMNYAAKSFSDGRDRFIMGWIRTKEGRKDNGSWEWGGHLSFPRQMVKGSDGSLYCGLPEQFDQIRGECKYSIDAQQDFQQTHGNWEKTSQGVMTAGQEQIYAEIELPGEFVEFDAKFEFEVKSGTRCAGIIMHADKENGGHPGYEVAVDFQSQKLVFRKHTKRFGAYTEQQVIVEDEEAVTMRVIVEKNLMEVFVNDRFALASSFYHFNEMAPLSFFVEEGSGTLRSMEVCELSPVSQPVLG